MLVFVDLQLEDQVHELVQYLSDVRSGKKDEPAADSEQKIPEAVAKVSSILQAEAVDAPALVDALLKEIEGAFSHLKPTDVEAAFNVVTNVIIHIDHSKANLSALSLQHQLERVQTWIMHPPAVAEGMTLPIRMKILSNIYNAVGADTPLTALRSKLFVAMLHLAVKDGRPADVLSANVVKALPTLMRDAWGIKDQQDQRRALSLIMAELDPSTSLYDECALTLLKSIDSTNEPISQQTLESATKVVISLAKRREATFSWPELAATPCIQALNTSQQESHRVAAELLQTLIKGNVADFQALAAQRKSQLAALDMTESDLEALGARMRLLTLCDLFTAAVHHQRSSQAGSASALPLSVSLPDSTAPASEHLDNVLSYDVVKSALNLEEDKDVEYWVLRGINESVVQAKLDQLHRCITITGSSHARQLSDAHWERMAVQLQGWVDGVSGILSRMHVAKEKGLRATASKQEAV